MKENMAISHSCLSPTGLPPWGSGKNPTANAGDVVQSLGQEDLLEKEIATHSNILV